MNAVRVELRVDERNVKSQHAVERLGAVKEGVMRMHMIEDGFIRNTVYYSFIHTEWPEAKTHLQSLLAKNYVAESKEKLAVEEI